MGDSKDFHGFWWLMCKMWRKKGRWIKGLAVLRWECIGDIGILKVFGSLCWEWLCSLAGLGTEMWVVLEMKCMGSCCGSGFKAFGVVLCRLRDYFCVLLIVYCVVLSNGDSIVLIYLLIHIVYCGIYIYYYIGLLYKETYNLLIII